MRTVLEINYRLLDNFSILHWSKMKMWDYSKAIALSMGYNPDEGGSPVLSNSLQSMIDRTGSHIMSIHEYNNPALFIGEQYYRISAILRCEINSGNKMFKVLDNYDDENMNGKHYHTYEVIAFDFCKWAKTHLPSFPEELYEAVVSSQSSSKTPAGNMSSGGNAGSQAKWAARTEIISKAINYVNAALLKGCEDCDHVQLADYMYQHASDNEGNILFEYPNIPEQELLGYLKTATKDALRQYPHRIVGNNEYKKSIGNCEIHSNNR